MRAVFGVVALLCVAAGPPPGASSCTGCHTKGAGIGVLQGRPADQIVAQMDGYRAGTIPATLMDRIAKGFTPEEIRALAAWFAQQ